MPIEAHFDVISRNGAVQDRLSTRIADLDRRLKAVETSRPGVQVVSGTPTSAPRNGTLAGDSSAVKLWLFINNGWHFTALT
jgi:hypothetical protein